MFAWKEQYGSGIAEVDKQHRHLVQLAGNLYELLQLGDKVDRYDEIRQVLGELTDYTIYHFGYEEELMQKNNFDPAAFKLHQAEHAAFVHKVKLLAEQDIDADQNKVLMDALMFAIGWIEKHILDTDMKYARYLTERGVR
ncbi:MAG: bacteriohemerythrin [Negativicutes bacterium]|nr:bacteriohemerythrin [Negativicutes bacterium]